MYAVTGITGQVGSAIATALLNAGQAVRAVVRDPAKAEHWRMAGAQIVQADFNDAAALEAAFAGTEGVFLMIPANFAPLPGFPEQKAIIAAMRTALLAAKPGKVVALSSVGAQHESGLGLITQLHLLEAALRDLPMPIAFVRAGWFMQNSLWDVVSARDSGTISSFLQPLDRAFPMVATEDIGRVSAQLLRESWSGIRVVEIEGPRRYSQNDIAAVFARLSGHPVEAVPVPRERWNALFESQGTSAESVLPRVEMLDGFNSGWIDFAGQGTEHVMGELTMEQVFEPVFNGLARLAAKTEA